MKRAPAAIAGLGDGGRGDEPRSTGGLSKLPCRHPNFPSEPHVSLLTSDLYNNMLVLFLSHHVCSDLLQQH